tara:strand:- start:158 stop:613 length:456 start_codon:yes stop_codon:yes gene_type:complete
MADEVDINIDQGSSFAYHMEWTDNNGVGVNLEQYTAKLDVRRSIIADKKLLSMHGCTVDSDGNALSRGITHGGSTGEFTQGAGVAGVGGIKLGVTSTGGTGMSGGIMIEIDSTSSNYIPSGRHFYDLELNSSTSIVRLIQGRFEVNGSVTR